MCIYSFFYASESLYFNSVWIACFMNIYRKVWFFLYTLNSFPFLSLLLESFSSNAPPMFIPSFDFWSNVSS